MRFIPTSSLDQVEFYEPFVPTSGWNELRSSIATSKSERSGYRNSVQAVQSLNDPADHIFLDFPQSVGKNPFSIVLKSVPDGFCERDVDCCFSDQDLTFLSSQSTATGQDTPEVNYDLELELLESVNEIATSLSRTRARRAASKDPSINECPLGP